MKSNASIQVIIQNWEYIKDFVQETAIELGSLHIYTFSSFISANAGSDEKQRI
jgi:hypothetical protein